MFRITALLILLSINFSFGQSAAVDSLKRVLSSEKDQTKKLEVLKQLASEAGRYDMEKELFYSKQGMALAEEISNKEWLPKFTEMTGRVYANKVMLDSASYFFDKAYTGYEAVNNKKGQGTTMFKMGWVAKRKNDLDKALDFDLKALKIMEEIDDKQGICAAYERISDDLTRQSRLKEAMDYAEKAIKVCKENNLTSEEFYVMFNAGDVYMAGGNFERSLENYKAAHAVGVAQGFDAASMSDITNSRGNGYKRVGRYKEALKDYEDALALAKSVNYQNAYTACLANLGEVNMILGHYKEALVYQKETIALMEKNGEMSDVIENYGHISKTYEALNDLKSALFYQRKALVVRDSIASVESDEAMSRMLTQYETEKKEATITAQQNQLGQQQRIQWLGAGLVVVLVGFIIFGYISFRNRTKTNRLLSAKNAENELLLKEIHHRVKNNLEVVSSLLALQSAQIDDQNTKDAMLEGQNRVNSIGIVHQKLYQGENLGAIEMKDYFLNLSASIIDTFGADDRVKLEVAMEKLNLDIDTAVPLGLIVNELLTNTLKYAFPHGKQGKVSIKLEKQANGSLHLEVADNGPGKSGATQGTGFGSQLISLLTRQLNGIMREESIDGTRIIFDFKTA